MQNNCNQHELIEAKLAEILAFESWQPGARLHEAMAYSVLSGGKRLRARLVCAIASLETPLKQCVLQAAGAFELIHCYSLVHDDLPAMDDDFLRRGKPTCHIKYDEATAILVGDALQSLAFELLATLSCPAEQRVALISLLAQAVGPHGMALGQMLDIQPSTDNSQLPLTHKLKTGALFAACTQAGAILAGFAPDKQKSWHDFGHAYGLAFQMRDDLNDATLSVAELGKTPGKDAALGKITFANQDNRRAAYQQQCQICLEMASALSATKQLQPFLTLLEATNVA